MSKGQFQPDGVTYFDGRGVPDGTRGSHVPEQMGAGRAGNKFVSGGSAGTKPSTDGGASACPAGVSKHTGAEDLGSNPTSKAARPTPMGKGGASACPDGVRHFGGTSVSKKK